MDFPTFDFDTMNEADIRAEIIDPLLRYLGYRSGTENNIERERNLRYPKISLGRKKPTDPEVRGKADYILEARGVGRWVVEAKPPNKEIALDDVEQAYTYAALPEVAAAFFVLCNGRRMMIFRTADGPQVPASVDLAYEDLSKHRQVIMNMLSPDGLRRSILSRDVDTQRPLAKGLPSSVHIAGGLFEYGKVVANNPEMSKGVSRLQGMRFPIEKGAVWRDNDKIMVAIEHGHVHSLIAKLSAEMGLKRILYSSAAEEISTDPAQGTIFESTNTTVFERGRKMFDFFTQQEVVVQMDLTMNMFTEAIGALEGNRFRGKFFGYASVVLHAPSPPKLDIEMVGTFDLGLAW